MLPEQIAHEKLVIEKAVEAARLELEVAVDPTGSEVGEPIYYLGDGVAIEVEEQERQSFLGRTTKVPKYTVAKIVEIAGTRDDPPWTDVVPVKECDTIWEAAIEAVLAWVRNNIRLALEGAFPPREPTVEELDRGVAELSNTEACQPSTATDLAYDAWREKRHQ